MCQKTAQQTFAHRDGTEWVVSPPDEVHPSLGGEAIETLSDLVYAPSPEEICDMLVALRQYQKWSQAFTAAVLGVTKGAIVKWEAGKRKPNGAAAKLIFLLYSQIVEKTDKVKNCWDLAVWGGLPCRNSMTLIALCGTYWVPDSVIREISSTPAEQFRPQVRRVLGLDSKEPLSQA